MRRTLVALWFADIAGYSEHAAKDETSALRMVEILQTLSRKTVTRYNGRVVKFLGDAVLAEFPSAEPAAFSAAELSRQFEEQSARIGDRGQVRVGVHLGDVAVAPDGDLYGDVLRVRFLHRIRDEQKFNGIEELKAQIESDTRTARNYFNYAGVRNMLALL